MHMGLARGGKRGTARLNYRELADRFRLLERLGFTHADSCPMMEHPFTDSLGLPDDGYFAPTSRTGPQDFMY